MPFSFCSSLDKSPDDRRPWLNRADSGPDRGELAPDRGEPLASDWQEAIASLGARPRKERLRGMISQLCEGQWRSPSWLAQQLGMNADNPSERHLVPMVKQGLLERRYPDIPTHPEQAYRSHQIQSSLTLA